MATVAAVVFKHHEKGDGTFNVKIRVYHNQGIKYIDTTHFPTSNQLTKSLGIKDPFIKERVEKTLTGYRRDIDNLGSRLKFFTAEQLRDYLRDKDTVIDFIKFSRDYIAGLRKDGRKGPADNHRTVVNSLVDYFGRESIAMEEVNSNMLYDYERYLKRPRKMTRRNKPDAKEHVLTKAGLRKGGLHNHMRDLRTLFNEARRKFNNKDLGIIRIPHYPFETYKIGSAPKTKKRHLDIEQIRILANCAVPAGSRIELARDLYMLSFFLCGANAVDMYNHLHEIEPGMERWNYNRSKTCDQRDDDAFFSVKIVQEAWPLILKYQGVLRKRYSSASGLNTALSAGFKGLREITGFPDITLYWARHSFANIARNKCGVSKDDVGAALNHIDEEHATTDIYLDRDWSLIDRVQQKVLDYYWNYREDATAILGSPLGDAIPPEIQALAIEIAKKLMETSVGKGIGASGLAGMVPMELVR